MSKDPMAELKEGIDIIKKYLMKISDKGVKVGAMSALDLKRSLDMINSQMDNLQELASMVVYIK